MHCQWKNVSRIKSAIVTTGSILWHSKIPSVKRVVRWYTIQPPDWLGGKNLLIRSGRWDFPEHAQTFEDKMKSNCFSPAARLAFISVYLHWLWFSRWRNPQTSESSNKWPSNNNNKNNVMYWCYALSIDRAAPSRELLLAQPSMDRAALSMDEHRPVLSAFRARWTLVLGSGHC